MSSNWVAVASAEHVRLGRSQGFMQVCHGKAAPLRRIQPGDGEAHFGEFDGNREADVSLADNADARGVIRDASAQPRCVIHGRLHHSTVTLLARFRGWSTLQPRSTPR